MSRAAALLVLLVLSSCGDVPPTLVNEEQPADAGVDSTRTGTRCNPATEVCHATLSSCFGSVEGLDLAHAQESPVTTQDPDQTTGPSATVDLTARLSRFLVLAGAGLDSLCLVGTGFRDLTEIPADTTGCSWSRNELLGVLTNPYPGSQGVGRGLLVRDRTGAELYKLRITFDDFIPSTACGGTEDHAGTVSFEYTRVAP